MSSCHLFWGTTGVTFRGSGVSIGGGDGFLGQINCPGSCCRRNKSLINGPINKLSSTGVIFYKAYFHIRVITYPIYNGVFGGPPCRCRFIFTFCKGLLFSGSSNPLGFPEGWHRRGSSLRSPSVCPWRFCRVLPPRKKQGQGAKGARGAWGELRNKLTNTTVINRKTQKKQCYCYILDFYIRIDWSSLKTLK